MCLASHRVVWKLQPLGGGSVSSLVIDAPGSCSVDPSGQWTYEAGLLKTAEMMCLTGPAGSYSHRRGDGWPAVTLEPCSSNSTTGRQHWVRDSTNRYHLSGNGSLCLNGFEPYTPPTTKLQVYPCSPQTSTNEQFTIASNGSLVSAKGGCVRRRTTEIETVQIDKRLLLFSYSYHRRHHRQGFGLLSAMACFHLRA
eukprot:COSAG01_NODE_29498_length_635_cov_0.951583_1_plen_195_part_10